MKNVLRFLKPALLVAGVMVLTSCGGGDGGTSAALTTGITWTSPNAVAATVNTSGLATGVAARTTTITARSVAISGSKVLKGTVTAPVRAKIYASYTGSQQGVTVRNLNLNQTSNFSTGFNISGIDAGPNNEIYLASGNKLYRYHASGALITTMTFPDPLINYTDVSYAGP